MKLNIDGDRLRLRLSEDQLDRLQRERQLEAELACANGRLARRTLVLDAGLDLPACEGDLMALRVRLPHAAFLAFVNERPRRDGFSFSADTLEITVEVDVRDSRRKQAAANTR